MFQNDPYHISQKITEQATKEREHRINDENILSLSAGATCPRGDILYRTKKALFVIPSLNSKIYNINLSSESEVYRSPKKHYMFSRILLCCSLKILPFLFIICNIQLLCIYLMQYTLILFKIFQNISNRERANIIQILLLLLTT